MFMDNFTHQNEHIRRRLKLIIATNHIYLYPLTYSKLVSKYKLTKFGFKSRYNLRKSILNNVIWKVLTGISTFVLHIFRLVALIQVNIKQMSQMLRVLNVFYAKLCKT